MQIFLFSSLLLALAGLCHASDTVLSAHGSGATNAAMCMRSVMEEIQARAKLPVRLTYRATGSSTGLTEFVNDFNPERSAMDFGMGEIPMAKEEWQKFQDANVTVLQLPVLFGAVSFFHSVPGISDVNLTSCLLARIFTREIKDWAHPEIRELNPGLDQIFEDQANGDSLGASLRIRVARRSNGSGSTQSVTEYLNKACPQYFMEDMVSDLPSWPVDTESCEGTQGMVACIEERAGTIGYVDAVTGIQAGLPEISLKNKYGKLLTSQMASDNGGIGAQEPGILPASPTDDFSSVSVLDQDGEFTWPITLLSYLYVRADLSFMSEPQERSLLVALIKALFEFDYTERCHTEYGFTLASGSALELGEKGIAMLESRLGEDATPWTFEDAVLAIEGTGDYVLSSRRSNYQSWERLNALKGVDTLSDTIAELQAEIAELSAAQSMTSPESGEYDDEEEAKVMAALVLGAVGAILGLAALVLAGLRGSSPGSKDGEEQEQAPDA